MALLLVRGTSTLFDTLSTFEKELYRNSIIFLTDTGLILVDNVYYGLSKEDSSRLDEVINEVSKLNYFNGVTDGTVDGTCEIALGTSGLLKITGSEDVLVTVNCDGVNINLSIKEGSENGTISVNGKNVLIHGLGTAAFENTELFGKADDVKNLLDRMLDAESNIEKALNDIVQNTELANSKVAKIESLSNSIVIDNTDHTLPKVSLKIDELTSGNVVLAQTENGLRAEVDIPFKAVSENDKILSLADNGHLSTNLNITYTDKTIYLRGKNNQVISSIDATDFVKDGMLNKVELLDLYDGNVGPWLKFTWNTDSGEAGKPMYVNMKSLVDVYDGTNVKLVNPAVSEEDRSPIRKNMSLDEAIGNIVLDIKDSNNSISNLDSKIDQIESDIKDQIDTEIGNLGTAAFKNVEYFATAELGSKADSAIQTIDSINAGTYITIGTSVNDNNITLTPELIIEKMDEAGDSSHGLAESADVKNYINNLLAWGTF